MVERRGTPRGGAQELGVALLNPRAEAVECAITNVGVRGARLTFEHPMLLPKNFDLTFRSGHRTRVKVVWQRGKLAGVQFETPLRRAVTKQTGFFARLLKARA